jgi:formylglycine-generating enzyme required for sulfatase activity
MKFVLIPAGEFLRGAPDSDSDAHANEKPQHLVRITEPFYLGVCEVTQADYQKVTGSNPSVFKDPHGFLPVDSVSWDESQGFCTELSGLARELTAGRRYRLPTQAEWEYACRAGSTTEYSFGDSEALLGKYAWYAGNSGRTTHPVGQKLPNAWGLYDMHGNVCEWCHDWYDESYFGQFSSQTAVDPKGPQQASVYRTHSVGSWDFPAATCRSSGHGGWYPSKRSNNIGFRVALDIPSRGASPGK